MAFLTLNDITVPVANDAAEEQPVDIGDYGRAYDGSPNLSLQSTKRNLPITMIPLVAADAIVWDHYLRGDGFHWSFDTSLYADVRGLGPNAGFVATQLAGTPKFGAGVLRLTATTGTITYATKLGTAWTVLVWRWNGSAWDHYIVTSGGHKWLNGVRNDGTSTTWLTVSGAGDVTIAQTPATTQDYDDLVALPFVMPDSWGPTWGAQTQAFSNLPQLRAAGSAIQEATTRTVIGQVGIGKFIQGYLGGVWASGNRKIAALLMGA